MELLTEEQVREMVTNDHRDADDCMEYLNGLEVKMYKLEDVKTYMKR